MKKSLALIWLKLRIYWSNILNRKTYIATTEELEKENHTTLTILKQATRKIYSNFKYKYDSLKFLGDRMNTPAEMYLNSSKGLLEDDCDGYHAALYHLLDRNGYDSYLLTYMCNPYKKSHTVCVVKENKKYYLIDYMSTKSFKSLEDLMEYIKQSNNVYGYNLVKFNYSSNKYKIIVEKSY